MKREIWAAVVLRDWRCGELVKKAMSLSSSRAACTVGLTNWAADALGTTPEAWAVLEIRASASATLALSASCFVACVVVRARISASASWM